MLEKWAPGFRIETLTARSFYVPLHDTIYTNDSIFFRVVMGLQRVISVRYSKAMSNVALRSGTCDKCSPRSYDDFCYT